MADECFLTGSAAEVIPVVKVDNRVIGDGHPGPSRAIWPSGSAPDSQRLSQCNVRFRQARAGSAIVGADSCHGPVTVCADARPNLPASSPAISPAIPPPLQEYLGRQIAQTMHYTGAEWLVRDVREREERCSVMLASLGARPGQTVLDMGCGNGFYTLPMAKMVGANGRVLAVDIQPEMLVMLRARAEQEGVENITPILGSVHDPRLPAEASTYRCWWTCITSSPIRNRCWPPCTGTQAQRTARAG